MELIFYRDVVDCPCIFLSFYCEPFMPCNAWNHPSNCDCGWGGQWHGSYGGGGRSPSGVDKQIEYRDFFFKFWSNNRLALFESYTIPNAKCPVCGARVFFYQSPYGGRVFFDDLGPPWPKHPCTDNSLPTFGKAGCHDFPKHDLTPVANYKPKWMNEGWDPVTLTKIEHKDGMTIVVVERLENDDKVTLGINKKVTLDQRAPIFLQEHPKELGVFKISFLEIHSGFAFPTEEAGYRNARIAADVISWKESLVGSPVQQNKIALKLLFENETPHCQEISLVDKNIDFDAVDFWLDKSANGGNSDAAFNRTSIQKIRLAAKFSKGEAIVHRSGLRE